jgi:predicted dehydrogenase
MQIAIIGCGYVADLYMGTLGKHPQLELVGVTDRDGARATRFSRFHGAPVFPSLEALLAGSNAQLILNLTNPRSHFEVSLACLEAGRHVYSEKPLAMDFAQAAQLVETARAKGLNLSSAPCNLLGETAQTLWKALRENSVGPVRVVYAELDDGMVHRMPYRKWLSASGVPWPWKDEFEVGCTLEHAAYYLTWLVAFFGPIESVTAFSSCQIANKETDQPLDTQAPDFSVACLKFSSGVAARLTCGIVAPHDHRLRIIGDDGILATDDCWRFKGPVYIRRPMTLRRKMFLSPWKSRYPLLQGPGPAVGRRGAAEMDFCRGVAEMADAISAGRQPYLSSKFCLHINEVVLAIQNAGTDSSTYRVTTRFDPLEPLDWARA